MNRKNSIIGAVLIIAVVGGITVWQNMMTKTGEEGSVQSVVITDATPQATEPATETDRTDEKKPSVDKTQPEAGVSANDTPKSPAQKSSEEEIIRGKIVFNDTWVTAVSDMPSSIQVQTSTGKIKIGRGGWPCTSNIADVENVDSEIYFMIGDTVELKKVKMNENYSDVHGTDCPIKEGYVIKRINELPIQTLKGDVVTKSRLTSFPDSRSDTLLVIQKEYLRTNVNIISKGCLEDKYGSEDSLDAVSLGDTVEVHGRMLNEDTITFCSGFEQEDKDFYIKKVE